MDRHKLKLKIWGLVLTFLFSIGGAVYSFFGIKNNYEKLIQLDSQRLDEHRQ